MRIWLAACAGVLLAGCVGPKSTAALWSLQNAQLDRVVFQTPDRVRAEQAHAFEVELARTVLAAERARLERGVADCPGRERQALRPSVSDSVRDGVRVRAAGDAGVLAQTSQLALADWRLRRANATAQATFCDQARAALSGHIEAASRDDTLARLGQATVSRGTRAHAFEGDAQTALILYASGAIDSVTAPAPLPQYLAAVYGGALDVHEGTHADPAALVDRIAAAYPEWEPDALYAALGGRL